MDFIGRFESRSRGFRTRLEQIGLTLSTELPRAKTKSRHEVPTKNIMTKRPAILLVAGTHARSNSLATNSDRDASSLIVELLLKFNSWA